MSNTLPLNEFTFSLMSGQPFRRGSAFVRVPSFAQVCEVPFRHRHMKNEQSRHGVCGDY